MSEPIDILMEKSEEATDEWIFSYADLMSLLLGFFVILYSMSEIKEEKLELLRRDLAQTFTGEKKTKSDNFSPVTTEQRKLRAMSLLVESLGLGKSMDEVMEKVENREIERQELEAVKEVLSDTMGLADKKTTVFQVRPVNSDVLFEFAMPVATLFQPATTEFKADSKEKLEAMALTILDFKQATFVEILAHTDSRKPANTGFKDNWDYSAALAAKVAKTFAEAGLEPQKIHASGRADSMPIFPEKGANGGWITKNIERNRRIHIIVKKTAFEKRAENGNSQQKRKKGKKE